MQPGERIKHYRKIRGLTQSEFGAQLGFSHGYIADLERGRQKPSREFLERINEIFGISSDYILYSGTGIEWREMEKELMEIGLDDDKISQIQGHVLATLRLSGCEEFNRGYKSGKEEVCPIKDYDHLPTVTKKLINDMIEILGSGNDTMSNALKSNIKAFLQAIRDAKKRDDDPYPGEGKDMS